MCYCHSDAEFNLQSFQINLWSKGTIKVEWEYNIAENVNNQVKDKYLKIVL